MKVRVRLAPSPTGKLHIGTARTAVFNWLFARRHNGSFFLRIEDTDRERSQAEYTKSILDDLHWLGLTWDGDPMIQSERQAKHHHAISMLLVKGMAYRCYCNEEELETMRITQKQLGQAPRYDNRHRELTPEQERRFQNEGRDAVIRFRIDNNAKIYWNDMVRGPIQWRGSDLGGDMVIARQASADAIGEPLYNLAAVVDDAAMAISHVIRGEDHIANTAKQVLLYKALELPLPDFAHTPLILNSEGRKLSKRDGVTSIADFQHMGYTPEALVNYMTLLGWSAPKGMGERFSLEQATTVFDLTRVSKASARFDWDKLNWLNSQVLHEMPAKELFKVLKPLWQDRGWSCLAGDDWGEDLCTLLSHSLTLLQDGVEQAEPFFITPKLEADAQQQLEIEGSVDALRNLSKRLDSSAWDGREVAKAQQLIEEVTIATGVKKGLLMKSLRAALLGSLQGPDLLATWSLLARIGQDRQRLIRCI